MIPLEGTGLVPALDRGSEDLLPLRGAPFGQWSQIHRLGSHYTTDGEGKLDGRLIRWNRANLESIQFPNLNVRSSGNLHIGACVAHANSELLRGVADIELADKRAV